MPALSLPRNLCATLKLVEIHFNNYQILNGQKVLNHYNSNEIYKNVIDEMVSFVKEPPTPSKRPATGRIAIGSIKDLPTR